MAIDGLDFHLMTNRAEGRKKKTTPVRCVAGGKSAGGVPLILHKRN